MNLFDELFREISALEIMDTHEHLPLYERDRDQNADVFSEYLIHYFSRDLLSSGLPPEDFARLAAADSGLSPKEKWAVAAPYWERCRHTGYGQSLDISVKALYDLDGIHDSTIEALDCKFRESIRTGSYNRVLKEKSHIRKSIVDCYDFPAVVDSAYFIVSQNIGNLICPKDGGVLVQLETLSGRRINSLQRYIEGVEAFLEAALKNSRFFKCALAYSRSLDFAVTTFDAAEREFLPLITEWNTEIERDSQHFMPGKAFQDYVMHAILRYLDEKNAVLQIHTGMQEGNGNILSNCNPEPLCRLFQLYPGVRFDIFHTGYPYHHLLGAMAKMFPNVYIDMCWAHIISPPACVKMLEEWLETVPVNKIFGFGGDYCFVDGVYGHQYLARKNIAKALAGKVESGLFREERAVEIAQMLLRDNILQLL